MKNLIIKVLNARPEEVPSVKLMLYLGFFTGIFLATYDVAAPAIFLNYFQDENVLAQAFLVSGIIGIAATYIYAYLQARIPYKWLVYGFMVFMLATTTVVWVLSAFVAQQGYIVFAGFVLALPFSYISLLMFWGFFGRVFDLKQAKRIIGGIDTGQLIASIVALFSIAFVLDRGWIKTLDLFLVSMIGVTGMLVSAIAIASTANLQTKREGSVKSRTMPLKKLFTNNYTRLMTAFVVISLMCVTFIDYSFLNVINLQWETEAEKASFLANFEATVVIFSFLFQTFVTDWIIENYGLKTSLIINPVLALILAGAAIFTGFFMGFQPGEGVDLIWFFLAIAAAKLFIDSLKDALDGPTFKLYFLPINPNIKFDVNTKIEGFITALGGLVAGGILILMNQFNLSLIYILMGVTPLLLLWFFVTQKMYNGYRSTLEVALEEGKSTKKATHEHQAEELSAEGVNEQLTHLKFLQLTSPLNFEHKIRELANTDNLSLRAFAEKKIAELDLNFDKKGETVEGARELRELAHQAAASANQGEVLSVSDDRLYNLAKSINKDDRCLAAKLLRSLVNNSNIFVLLELLRDPDNEVRQQAIITARKVNRSETWPLLIELLGNKLFTYEAASALVAAGNQVLPVLENAFHRSGQTLSVMIKLINIMVEIGGEEAHQLLWQKIDFPDRKIVKQILISLSKNRYTATRKEALVLNDILNDEIGKALWNITAKTELTDEAYNQPLQQALDEEIKSNFDFIYMLLAIIYDPDSIELVKENIELGTTEGITYAIELLDIFLAQDMKPKLFPLLDDISAHEKLDKLQVFYPRQVYAESETYNYLLNRESSNVNRWTKACTLYAIAHNKDIALDDSIVAHMFNPDPLLAELATWITYKNKPAQYRSVLQRLTHKAEALERMVYRVENNLPLVFDVVIKLQAMPEFTGFTGLLLSQMVSQMHSFRLRQGEEFSVSQHPHEVFVVFEGTLQTNIGTARFSNPADSHLMGTIFCENEDAEINTKAQVPALMLGISLNSLFDILINYPELIKSFINRVANQYTKTEIIT